MTSMTMKDEAQVTALDCSSKADVLPRPAIKHLLIWVALTAVATCVVNWFYESVGVLELDISRIALATSITAASAVSAAQLTGGWVLWSSRKQREFLLTHPGHWVILWGVISIALTFYASLVYKLEAVFDFYSVDWTLWGWRMFKWSESLFQFVINVGIPGAIFLVAARRNRGIWKWLFVGCAVTSLCAWLGTFAYQALFSTGTSLIWYQGLAYVVSSIPVIAMLVLAVWEFRWGSRRDWVHWVGIAAYTILPIVSLIGYFMMAP